ncbi:hypothetical protein ACHQM5_022394 [Ranunculus cassubicifolius]
MMNFFFIIIFLYAVLSTVMSDPQINLLNQGCSQYNVTSPFVFMTNLNATFLDLRSQLSNGSNTRFATAQRPRETDPVYAMIQCRNYLNTSDCVTCFDAAVTRIRRCSSPNANGARVVLDGCFLRYESRAFFDETTRDGNLGICSNRTVSQGTFAATVNSLISDLIVATPRIDGYFAATSREAPSSGGTIVYAIAQCADTVSQTGCSDCLIVAYNNIQRCPPEAEGKSVDSGCFLRYSDTAFFDTNQTIDITPVLRSGGSSNSKTIIGAAVGGGAFLLLVVMFIMWFTIFRKKKKSERKGDILGATELRGPVSFKYKDLISATKNFSEENKLGEGGFGDVYKGTLKNGNIVAVKRLAIGISARVQSEFESEVKLISNVHHRNLVRLLGCCNKSQELLLVYEYMANSSLDKFLFDIKSSNILLDDDFQARIADFGLARLLPEDQSHVNTRFAGTLGYTAPEYAIHGTLSPKVDTYSFGVVVLEIISGRKSNDLKLEPITQYLLEWAWRLYEENSLMSLVDESLDSNDYSAEEVMKVIEIALLCTQSSNILRPTMSEVVVLLLSKGATEFAPTRPTFIDSTKRVRGDTSTSNSTTTASSASTATNATVSFTETSGR